MNIQQAAELLGFEPGAAITEDDIVKAYKDKAKTTHPDMGGNDEDFRQCTLAYNVLREAVKRPASPGQRIRAKCPKCAGRGVIDNRRAWRVLKVRCPECKGTGASQPQGV